MVMRRGIIERRGGEDYWERWPKSSMASAAAWTGEEGAVTMGGVSDRDRCSVNAIA